MALASQPIETLHGFTPACELLQPSDAAGNTHRNAFIHLRPVIRPNYMLTFVVSARDATQYSRITQKGQYTGIHERKPAQATRVARTKRWRPGNNLDWLHEH